MGSTLKPKSTRSRRGRSAVQSSPKPVGTPDVKPAPAVPEAGVRREIQADAILQAARRTAPARGLSGMPLPETFSPLTALLQDLRERLSVVCAVVLTAAAALKSQSADIDADVSMTLRHCVGNELDRQIERIDNLIGGVAP